jgi:hypothetical protein
MMLVVYVGLFHQQMKISVKHNIKTDSGMLPFFMCGAPLFFTPFAICYTEKRMNICVPSVKRFPGWYLPIFAACGSTSTEACHPPPPLLLPLLLLVLLLLLKIVFNIASLST